MSMHQINGVYIADTARVLGQVELAENVSIWYGVTIRADFAKICIGEGTNVQDNAVIHCDHELDHFIGRRVTIAHGAIVHGQYVGDDTLIGMNATILNRSRIGRGCVIGAEAVVTPDMEVPDGMAVLGVPGRIVRPTNEDEKRFIQRASTQYIKWAKRYTENPDDPCIRAWSV